MLNWAMTAASETTSVLAEVAGRLRTLRTERGLTLIELSTTTGISKSTLSRLETGQRKPSLELLLPIAQAYRVALDDLVGAPEVGDPRIRPQPQKRGGRDRRAADPASERNARVEGADPARTERPQLKSHDGYEWLYVLSGELRLTARRSRHHDEGRRGRRVRHAGPALVRRSRRSARRDPQPPQPAGRARPRPRCASPQERRCTTAAGRASRSVHDGVLLETKLHAPRRRHGVVRTVATRRTSVVDRRYQQWCSCRHRPASARRRCWPSGSPPPSITGRRTAWLSLDRRRQRPGRVLVLRDRGAAQGRPRVGHRGSACRCSPHLQTSTPSSAPWSTTSAALDDIVLVLDDYHVIESIDVHESMRFLVDHLPPPVPPRGRDASRPAVAAGIAPRPGRPARDPRRRPPLHHRARRRRTSTTRWVSTWRPTTSRSLEARTEGWIAALQLAALSLQGRDDRSTFIAEFAGDDRFVVDYLADEVLDRQPADIRSFLLRDLDPRPPDRRAVRRRHRAGATAGRCSSRSTGRTCSSSPSTTAATGTATTTSSPTSFEPASPTSTPTQIADSTGAPCAWYADARRPRRGDHPCDGRRRRRPSRTAHRARRSGAAPATPGGTLRRWLEALPDQRLRRTVRCSPSAWSAPAWPPATPPASSRCSSWWSRRWRRSSLHRSSFDDDEFAGLPAQVLVLPRRHSPCSPVTSTRRSPTPPRRSIWSNRPTTSAAAAHPRCWRSPTGPAGDLDAAEQLLHRCDRRAHRRRPPRRRARLLARARRHPDRPGPTHRRHANLRRRASLDHRAPRAARRRRHARRAERSAHRTQRPRRRRPATCETSTELGESAGLPQHAYRWRVTMARLCRARGDLDGALELIDEAAPLYDTDFSPPVRPVAAIRARVQLAARRPRRRDCSGSPNAASPSTTSSATSTSTNTSPSPGS